MNNHEKFLCVKCRYEKIFYFLRLFRVTFDDSIQNCFYYFLYHSKTNFLKFSIYSLYYYNNFKECKVCINIRFNEREKIWTFTPQFNNTTTVLNMRIKKFRKMTINSLHIRC